MALTFRLEDSEKTAVRSCDFPITVASFNWELANDFSDDFSDHDATIAQQACRSVECKSFSILVLGHADEVMSRVDVSCPAKEEFLECFKGSGPHRINDAAEGDLHRKALRPRYGDQLEMIRERPRPIGDQMVLSE